MKRLIPAILVIPALALLAGCFNPFSPDILTERVTTQAPSPTTPQNAIRLFEWCWVNRGVEEYKELFTDDYQFKPAGADSAGNDVRDVLTRREDEVETAANMFIGTAERPPASKITLNLDRNFIPFPDGRVGKNPTWHKSIRTSVDLKVDIGEGQILEVTGYALFYLTRGDSAAIPAELKLKGFKPDSLRWWIDRWEDETLPPNGLALRRPAARAGTRATVPVSLAQLKSLYR